MNELEHVLALVSGRTDVQAALVVLASLLVAWLAGWMLELLMGAITKRTASDLDDRVVHALRRPLGVSIVLLGTHEASLLLGVPTRLEFFVAGLLASAAVFVWTGAVLRISSVLLEHFSSRTRWIDVRTLPLFDIAAKIVVIGLAIYFGFLAWEINLTAWLASAGIIGIAVGFAAKDTLANLFSGIFILADAPYKVGDYIVVDGSLRGQVTRIGMRSTRVLTRDDVEITIPNSLIANSKIVNEMGGPSPRQRVRVQIAVAYGTDIDLVQQVLLRSWIGVSGVLTSPEPRVRFRRFGESGLDFELLVWIEESPIRGKVLHELNSRVYKAFLAAGIEIPYAKRDLYIKQMPAPLPTDKDDN
jgi:small-conductance mechanosensitive channel